MGNTSICRQVLILYNQVSDQTSHYQNLLSEFDCTIITFPEFIKNCKMQRYPIMLVPNNLRHLYVSFLETYAKSLQINPYYTYYDETYLENSNIEYFSKMIKESIKQYQSSKNNISKKKSHIDIKFIDHEVNSSTYQTFINLIKNKGLTFQTFDNINDFRVSQKSSQCKFIICCKQFLKVLIDQHQQIICFTPKQDQTENFMYHKGLMFENNFMRIIKHIKRKLEYDRAAHNYPIKSLFVIKTGLSVDFLRDINRKKTKVKIVKSDTVSETIDNLSKELFSTLIIANDAELQDSICTRIEDMKLQRRINILKLVGNEAKFLNTLDQYIDGHYKCIPHVFDCIWIIGSVQYMNRLNYLKGQLHLLNISVKFMHIENYRCSLHYPIVILTQANCVQQLTRTKQLLHYKTLIICFDQQQALEEIQEYPVTLATQDLNVVKTFLAEKIYYLIDEFTCKSTYFRLTERITQLEKDRNVLFDLDLSDNNLKCFSTLKFVKFHDKETHTMEKLLKKYVELWQLKYNPIEEIEIFKYHLENSLKNFVKYGFIKLTLYELEIRYTSKLRAAQYFSEILTLFTHIYQVDFYFRINLNRILGSVDMYCDFQKIEDLKPIVILIFNNYSGLFNLAKNERTSMMIRVSKNTYKDLAKNNYLNNLQFIECYNESKPKKKKNQSYIRIEYQNQPLKNLSLYSYSFDANFNDKSVTLISPYSTFAILENEETFQSSELRLKLLKGTNYLSMIIENNSFLLSNYKGFLSKYFVDSKLPFLIHSVESDQFNARLLYNDFIKCLKSQKYFEAEHKLAQFIEIAHNQYAELISISKIWLLINMGKIHKACEELEKLSTTYVYHKFQNQIKKIQDLIDLEQFQLFNVETESVVKWEVTYDREVDKFVLKNQNKQNQYYTSGRINLLSSKIIKPERFQYEQNIDHNKNRKRTSMVLQEETLKVYQEFFITNNFGKKRPNVSAFKCIDKHESIMLQDHDNKIAEKQNLNQTMDVTKQKKHFKIIKRSRMVHR